MIRFCLIKKELHDQRWIVSLGLILLILLGGLFAFSFEWFIVELDGLVIKDFNGPQWLQNTLKSIPQIKDYSYAIWSNWNPKNLIQIGTLMAVLLGSLTFAGEIEHTTITFLLTNRLTRQSIFHAKVVASVIGLAIIFMVPTLFLPIFSVWSGHALTTFRIIGASFITYLGGLIILSLTILVSIKLQDRIKALLAMFVIIFMQMIMSFIPVLNYFSLFKYTNAASYYFGVMSYPWLTAFAMILVSVLLLRLSYYYFTRCDF